MKDMLVALSKNVVTETLITLQKSKDVNHAEDFCKVTLEHWDDHLPFELRGFIASSIRIENALGKFTEEVYEKLKPLEDKHNQEAIYKSRYQTYRDADDRTNNDNNSLQSCRSEGNSTDSDTPVTP